MKLRELRQLAGEATPGPWRVNRSGIDQNGFEFIEISADEDVNVEIALLPTRRDESRSDAKYIAVCSPEVIQALCDAAGALEKMHGAYRKEVWRENNPSGVQTAHPILEMASAALTRLRNAGLEMG